MILQKNAQSNKITCTKLPFNKAEFQIIRITIKLNSFEYTYIILKRYNINIQNVFCELKYQPYIEFDNKLEYPNCAMTSTALA